MGHEATLLYQEENNVSNTPVYLLPTHAHLGSGSVSHQPSNLSIGYVSISFDRLIVASSHAAFLLHYRPKVTRGVSKIAPGSQIKLFNPQDSPAA
jgi:hypothetical protein